MIIRDTDDDLQLQGPNPTIAFVADTDADGDTSSEIKFYTGMSLETDPDYQAGIEATPTGNLIFRAGGDSDTNKIRIRPGGQVTFSRGTQDADSDNAVATKSYVDDAVASITGESIGIAAGPGLTTTPNLSLIHISEPTRPY